MHLLLIICVIAAVVWWAWKVTDYYTFNRDAMTSACTGDCDQGRNCTCVKQQDNAAWPFPKDRP